MELALRNSLNSIFARHDEAHRRPQDVVALEDKVSRRLALFREKRETMFRPVMDAVGAYLLTKGYEHEILVFEPDDTRPVSERESRFCFHVIKPPRVHHARDYPGLSVVCDPFSNTVRFRASRMWSGGGWGFVPAGAVTVEEASLSVFQEQMLAFLAAVFH